MKKFFQKLSSIGTPEWRLASLFLWWGVFHFTWMLLLLWTNSDQVMSTGFVVIVSWLVTGLLLLLTHINSLTFRPMRKTRILLWMGIHCNAWSVVVAAIPENGLFLLWTGAAVFRFSGTIYRRCNAYWERVA